MEKNNSISIALQNLRQRQSLPLQAKIAMTKERVRAWYEHWDGEVYVSFSGGKDSTVLLEIVRSIYPDVPGVFCDTGLEFPEIRQFVKTKENIVWLKPEKTFKWVLENVGFPLVSKKVARFIRDLKRPEGKMEATKNLRLTGFNQKGVYCPSQKIPKKWIHLKDAPFKISEQCCDYFKKKPFLKYVKKTGRHPMNGVMAEESDRRNKMYLENGCNNYDAKDPISTPMAFWTNQDVLLYLRESGIGYASVYGDIVGQSGSLEMTGEPRTGCVFCMFGVHLEKGENRFQRLQRTHPKLHKHCGEKLGLRKILSYIGVDFDIKETQKSLFEEQE
jgi:3'-phosphoadenosine 5'-phosphosulfate sulfotransferase (PAPS reductase)/FAD synthetase